MDQGSDTIFFSLLHSPDGWWVEFTAPEQTATIAVVGTLAVVGPFGTASEALRFGERKGWERLDTSSAIVAAK